LGPRIVVIRSVQQAAEAAWTYSIAVINQCTYSIAVINQCTYSMAVINQWTYSIAVINQWTYSMAVVNQWTYSIAVLYCTCGRPVAFTSCLPWMKREAAEHSPASHASHVVARAAARVLAMEPTLQVVEPALVCTGDAVSSY
jgi:hypothetical protein